MANYKHALHFAAIYGSVAPLIGYLGIMVLIIISTILSNLYSGSIGFSTLQGLLFVGFVGIFVAYIIGFIPAFITGLIVGYINDPKTEMISAALVGALLTFLLGLAFFRNMEGAIMQAVIGGISGAICASRPFYRNKKYS